MLLNKLTARTNLITHKHRENPVGLGRILNRHLLQDAGCGVHSGLPQLVLVHLTKTFVPLYGNTLGAQLSGNLCPLLVSPAVVFGVTLLNKVERGHCNVDVALLDELLHLAEEECQHQSRNVATIHIRIGHNDNLVVAQFLQVECLGVLLSTDGYTQCGKHILNLLILPHTVLLHFLDVENLTPQGHNGLILAVAALLCSTTCRITLNEENLRLAPIPCGAVGQLTGKARTRQHCLALHKFPCVAGSVAGSGSQHNLVHNSLGILRVLLKVVGQSLRDGLVHSGSNLVITEFGFGLALKLRLGNLHRHNSREALAEVVARDVELNLRKHTILLGIFFHRAGESPTETGQVGTTLDGVDVVHIGVHVLREAVVVLHSHLHGGTVFLGVDVDNVVNNLLTTALIKILNKALQAIVRVEVLVEILTLLIPLPAVGNVKVDTLVEECQLAQPCSQDFIAVDCGGEDVAIRLELNGGTGAVGLADNFQLRGGGTTAEGHLVNLTIPANRGNQFGRECVHTRHTNAVQTTRHLVGVLAKLTTGVQNGQNHLQGRFALLLVHTHRDTTAVIFHGD